MKPVLVTGGAGYIGSHTASALALAGFPVIVIDNFSTGWREFARFGETIEGDIRDTRLLIDAIREFEVNAVLHFAASAYVGESVQQAIDYFDNNVRGTISVLDAMRQTGVTTFVFSSSCATYGNPLAIPVRESDPQHPLSPYGESKLAIERMLPYLERAHGIHWLALRFFNAAGADPDGTLGERHEPETHLIPNLIRAAQDGSPATVFGWDYPTRDGTALRDYVHVSDIAAAHVLGLEYLKSGGVSTAVNLGSGHGHTIGEIISQIEMISGRPLEIEKLGRREGDATALVADPSRAMDLLGWQPARSTLDSIVSSAWNWHSGYG